MATRQMANTQSYSHSGWKEKVNTSCSTGYWEISASPNIALAYSMDSTLKIASFGFVPSVSLPSRKRHHFVGHACMFSRPASENKEERSNPKIILGRHR